MRTRWADYRTCHARVLGDGTFTTLRRVGAGIGLPEHWMRAARRRLRMYKEVTGGLAVENGGTEVAGARSKGHHSHHVGHPIQREARDPVQSNPKIWLRVLLRRCRSVGEGEVCLRFVYFFCA